MNKKPSNPLFLPGGGGGGFSLADSFGVTASLPVSSNAEEDSFVGGGGGPPPPQPTLLSSNTLTATAGLTGPASTNMVPSPISFFRSSPAVSEDLFSQVSGPQSVPLSCPPGPASPPQTLQTPAPAPTNLPSVPPSLPQPSPAPPQLFMPPPSGTPLPTSAVKRPIYAPTPFLNQPGGAPAPVPSPASSLNIAGLPPLPEPKTILDRSPFQPPAPAVIPPSQSAPSLAVVEEVTVHWFYRQQGELEVWKPFSVEDSTVIESKHSRGETSQPIPVDGTRYDAFIESRTKVPVYWPGRELAIRRCSWFHRRDPEGRWIPYEESQAERLEREYQAAKQSGRWQCKVVFDSGEWVMLHSPGVMMHFPTSSTSHGALDDWGQVQPQSDPASKPQVVHRGLEGLPDIPDGESMEVDHVFFVVHGIGAACDIKFRPLEEVVDGFRDITADMSEKHFAGAHLASRANRVEFLPVHWHERLHGEDQGTDKRIQPLTLRSIPKLRSFVNDTLLDVLFYTSPIYCQTILDTVCGEINRIYKLFCSRNPGFVGQCSVVGHSLGSLILFDLLSGQKDSEDQVEEAVAETETDQNNEEPKMPRWEKDLSLEEVFTKLEISDHVATFTDQGIGIEELETCTEDDLKEAGLPLGPRKRLMSYLSRRQTTKSGSYSEFQASSVARQVSYCVGPAGTGQLSVRYPRLDIKPTSFFALGSPIGMFLAVRGIDSLGVDFQFPTCKNFFNIFHPYDPVAYRIESLVDKEYASLRPYLVPHHMGRKRMHLELKETIGRVGNDIKQKIMDSLKAVYNVAGSITGQGEQAVEEMTQSEEDRSESPVENEVAGLEARLNAGRRIDFVLQEAPLESFNEYVFAVTSHLCYWESEDTSLMIIKEIYATMDIFADTELPLTKLYNPSISPPQFPSAGVTPQSPSLPRTVSVPTNIPQSFAAPGQVKPPPGGDIAPVVPSFLPQGPPVTPGLLPQGPPVTPGLLPQGPPVTPGLLPQGPPVTPGLLPQPPPVTPGLFNVSSLPQSSVQSRPGLSSYPRPQPVEKSGVVGMDPTAPLTMERPVGPPPTGGFMR